MDEIWPTWLAIFYLMQAVGLVCMVAGWYLRGEWPDVVPGEEPAQVFDGTEEDETAEAPVFHASLAQWFTGETVNLGGFSLAGAAPHKHPTAMGKSDNEGGPVGVPIPDPEPEPERVVARRSMSAMSVDERLESRTVPITKRVAMKADPWWYENRFGDYRARLARVPEFLGNDFATTEQPQLDWSSHPTASVPEVQVGRRRSGEYPVVGVSG